MKDLCAFLRIVIIAIVLALVVWGFADASETKLEDLVTWEAISRSQFGSEIFYLFSNPNYEEDDRFAIMVVNKQNMIVGLIVIGRDMCFYQNMFGTFVKKELAPELKKKIWGFLRKQVYFHQIGGRLWM